MDRWARVPNCFFDYLQTWYISWYRRVYFLQFGSWELLEIPFCAFWIWLSESISTNDKADISAKCFGGHAPWKLICSSLLEWAVFSTNPLPCFAHEISAIVFAQIYVKQSHLAQNLPNNQSFQFSWGLFYGWLQWRYVCWQTPIGTQIFR